MHLTRIDRKYARITVNATDDEGIPTAVTGVDVALLAPRTTPSSTTSWTPAVYANGVASVLLAGPDASSTGALVVPGTADLWMRITDTPEIDAAFVEKVTVDAAPPMAPLPTPLDAAIASLLNDPTSATYAKVLALIESRTGFGRGA